MPAHQDPRAAAPSPAVTPRSSPGTPKKSPRRFSLLNKLSSRQPPPERQSPPSPTPSPSRMSLLRSRPATATATATPRTPHRERGYEPGREHGPQPPSLAIRVNVNFEHPLDIDYENTFEASASFEPAVEICEGLLRRIDYGCSELITRDDPSALLNGPGDKPLRFELVFAINRAGRTWAVKSYKSYQRRPLDRRDARYVTDAADRLIRSFLDRYDANFKGHPNELGSVRGRETERENEGDRPSSSWEPVRRPSSSSSAASVPRSRFVPSRQDYAFIPGYEIALQFKNRCHSRREVTWERSLVVRSNQGTPLTVTLGEDLTWKLSKALDEMLEARKIVLDSRRAAHDDLEEGSDSDDFSSLEDEDALHVGFRVRNNLGVDFSHLCRTVDTKLPLFHHPEGLDCQDFTERLERAASAARDGTDTALGRLDDLKITVRELSGQHWSVKSPFSVSLDSSTCYSRRITQAVLDRVQAGVADELAGIDARITLTATKRGHVVLDETLDFVANPPASGHRPFEEPQDAQQALLSRLKRRMQTDVAMAICDAGSRPSTHQTLPRNLRLTERSGRTPAGTPKKQRDAQSLDQLMSASMALATELGQVPDASSRRLSNESQQQLRHPEISHRPSIETNHRESSGESSSQRHSAAAISFTMTDGAETTSTRLSTPSLGDDAKYDSRQESEENGPSTPRRSSTTMATKRPDVDDDVRVHAVAGKRSPGRSPSVVDEGSATPRRESRRFSLLGRASPQVSRGRSSRETTRTDVQDKQKGDVPFEGWLGYSCEPIGREDSEQATTPVQTVALAIDAVDATVGPIPQTATATEDSEQTTTPVQAAALAVDALEATATPIPPTAAVTEPSEMEGFLEYCVESIDDASGCNPAAEGHSNSNRGVEKDIMADIEPPTLIGLGGEPKTPTRTPTSPTAPSQSRLANSTPEPPHTPAMTNDSDSASSHMEYSPSPSRRPRPALATSECTSAKTLSLWSSRPGSVFLPDDEHLSSGVPEPPSQLARPRPQSAHANAVFASSPLSPSPSSSLSPSVSPTATPRPVRRSAGVAGHRRQFSTPTAGYLGLLHTYGSPLRQHSYAYQDDEQTQDREQQENEQQRLPQRSDRDASIRGQPRPRSERFRERRPSDVLLGYWDTPGVERRPLSSLGLPGQA